MNRVIGFVAEVFLLGAVASFTWAQAAPTPDPAAPFAPFEHLNNGRVRFSRAMRQLSRHCTAPIPEQVEAAIAIVRCRNELSGN